MLTTTRSTGLRVAPILLFAALLVSSVPATQSAGASENEALTVRVGIFDIETGLPIPNMMASFYLTTREDVFFIGEGDLLTLQGVTSDDGLIVSTLSFSEIPEEPIRLVLAAVDSQHSGVWIIEKVVGDGEYWLWSDRGDWSGPRWMGIEPGQFLDNVSIYAFPRPVPTHFDRIDEESAIDISLYLRAGRLANLTLINPFHGDDPWFLKAVPSFWLRMRFSETNLYFPGNYYQHGNFAPVENSTLAVAPLNEPLEGTAFVARMSMISGWRMGNFIGSWTFSFSSGVDEGYQIDLTPMALRSISETSEDELSSLLEDLARYGFPLSNYHAELSKAKISYQQAISAFEMQKIPEGVVFSRKADDLHTSLVTDIQRIPTQALPSSSWIIITLLFFSLCLSYLVTEVRAKALVLFDVLFFVSFTIFALTQPYLRLLLSNPISSFRRIDVEFLNALMQIGLPAIVAGLFLVMSKRVRDTIKQTFGVAVKNLRRRRMRTTLTLTVILIISASAMSLLSTGFPLQSVNARIPLNPLISDGLVVYKYRFGTTSTTSLSFEPFEIDWLAQQEWVNASSTYAVKIARVSNGTTTLQRYNQFYLAAVNPAFLERFTNAAEILGSGSLPAEGEGSVLVGQRIAEAYQLRAGGEILIDGEAFTVKGTFDEDAVVNGLLDIDGDKLLFKVFDPATRTVAVPPTVFPPYPQTGPLASSFLICSIGDFSLSELPISKISLIVNEESVDKIDKITEEILWASYEKREDYVTTFSVCEIRGGAVTVRYLTFETVTLVGSWQTQVVPLIICGLIIFVTLHGSVYERRNEIKTLSALGLSPLRVRVTFLMEGLTLGVLGGVLGYVFGFGLIKFGNIALIEGIEENMATGSPLLISMVIAVLVSVAGCLLPAREAVLLAVPSKELLKKYAGIIDVHRGFAVLDIPLRISIHNLRSFDNYMTDILSRHPTASTPHGMFGIRAEKTETDADITYNIVVCYASERTAYYLVRLSLLKETEPMKIKTLIFPVDRVTLETLDRWSVDHEHLLPRLAPILRQDLLSYIERK